MSLHYEPRISSNPPPADPRLLVVQAAESQLGNSDPTPYWLEVYGSVPVPAPGKRIHWCGAGALWCLRQAGLCDWLWSFSRRHPGFVWRLGATTRSPHPADIVVCERGWHHAVVSAEPFERGEQVLVPSIDFNSGATPGVVARHQRPLLRRKVYYYSIQSLVDAKLKADDEIKGLLK